MPLTSAEKMRRYREKLKNDPERYEMHKKKDLGRIKAKIKKVSEMTEKEKEAKRKLWREQKRRQKEMKNQKLSKEVAAELPSIAPKKKNVYQRTIRNLSKRLHLALARISSLKKTCVNLRKQSYRIKKGFSKKVAELEETITKMKMRDEILEATIRRTYKKCGTIKEKNVLKNLAKDELVKNKKHKNYVTKLLGLRGKVRENKKKRDTKKLKIELEIEKFFLRDDISRNTAGKKECRTLNKIKKQKRYLTDTLFNLFKIYKNEGGKLSFSTFHKYKPFFVLSPNVNNRETCLCIKHENIFFLFYALKKNKVLPDYKNITEILLSLTCDIKSYNCMYNSCKKCKRNQLQYNLEEVKTDINVEWLQWQRIDHEFERIENGVAKTKTSKKTVKQLQKGTIGQLIALFNTNIKEFKKHYFNWKHQQSEYQKCIKNLGSDEVLILCDFSQNYVCKMGKEIQSMHFGASKNQISLHCGMIYWAKESQSFCTISESKCHEPAAIWAHLLPIIKEIKSQTPNIKTIHVFSDGPTSQYRQKKNFYLLNLFSTKLKLNCITWSFSESGHGKGVADGIGGAIKRALDRQVAYNNDVTNAVDAVNILTNCMKTVKCFYIPETDITNIATLVPNNLKRIIGTLKIHQIISHIENEVYYRNLSCFCTPGCSCKCYQPAKHCFKKTTGILESTTATNEVTLLSSHDTIVHEGQIHHGNETNFTVEDNDIVTCADLTEIDASFNIDNDSFFKIFDKNGIETYFNLSDQNDETSIFMTNISTNSIKNRTTEVEKTNEMCNQILSNKLNLETEQVNVSDNTISDSNMNSNIKYSNETKKNIDVCCYSECNSIDKKHKFKLFSEPLQKENNPRELKRIQFKTLKTTVTRSVKCSLCTSALPIYSAAVSMATCMSCKKKFCGKCSDGQFYRDYLCCKCLEG